MSFGHVYCSVGCIGCSKAHISCMHIHSSEAPNRCQAPLEALGFLAHVSVPIDLTYVALPSHITYRRRVVNACLYEHIKQNGVQNTAATDFPFFNFCFNGNSFSWIFLVHPALQTKMCKVESWHHTYNVL